MPFVYPFWTPGPLCQLGMAKVLLTPPPPPAPFGLRCVLFGFDQTDSLPYASSLCGACFEACPVRIDIPEVLVHLRAQVVDAHRGGPPKPEALAMKTASWGLSDARRLGFAERGLGIANRALTRFGRHVLPGGRRALSRLPWPGSLWTNARDLPVPPRESFRSWWRRERG